MQEKQGVVRRDKLEEIPSNAIGDRIVRANFQRQIEGLVVGHVQNFFNGFWPHVRPRKLPRRAVIQVVETAREAVRVIVGVEKG